MGIAISTQGVKQDRITSVLVVDDHELLANMLASSLEDAGFEVGVATGCRTVDAVAVAAEFRPDVCLLDLDLGPAGDGRLLISQLSSLGCEVILVTGSRDEAAIGEGLEGGAFGVMTKDAPFESIVEAVVAAADGRSDAFANSRSRFLAALRQQRSGLQERLAPFERLTSREREVLAELGRGSSAAAIAEASYVSLSTVRSQIRSVLTKLGVSSQLAAVALAHEAGWLGAGIPNSEDDRVGAGG
ncbi:MAG: response regulator transcription factor [Acidimicrobiia bacterium]|nr:response regulator transcription factor [Acidimicrobiia bacterium]